MIDLGHGYGYGHSWAVVSPALKNVDIRKAAQKAARNGCPLFFVSDFRFWLFAHAAHWERKKSGHLPKAEVCFWIRFLPLLCRFSVEIFRILSRFLVVSRDFDCYVGV
jgi:hypothetical protein